MSQQSFWGEKPPRRIRKDLSREHYMAWAGWFAHPQEDIDVFVRLPKWRQQEILATRNAFRKDPTLQSSELHDVTGRVPDQEVYTAPVNLYQSILGPPNSIKYNVPDGIPLELVKRLGSRSIKDELDRLTESERRELAVRRKF